eukprot:3999240-Pleurochrysis_carterae.AAC.2
MRKQSSCAGQTSRQARKKGELFKRSTKSSSAFVRWTPTYAVSKKRGGARERAHKQREEYLAVKPAASMRPVLETSKTPPQRRASEAQPNCKTSNSCVLLNHLLYSSRLLACETRA